MKILKIGQVLDQLQFLLHWMKKVR